MKKTVNLLWTSGWDSTYRLLDLVLVQKRPVQPYYIISRTRQIWELEIRTMEKIKQLISAKDPEAGQWLLPTIYKERDTIQPNARITEQYNRLNALKHLGDQHDYISRYAEEIGIYDLEMCIDTRSPGFFTTYVKPNLVKEHDEDRYNFSVAENPTDSDLTFFKYFKFPIHELTKADMQDLATQHGFIDIMEHTWFCHSPRNNQPCGVCTPCMVTMEHGLRRRIPLASQWRNFLWYTVKPPIKKILKPAKKSLVTHVA